MLLQEQLLRLPYHRVLNNYQYYFGVPYSDSGILNPQKPYSNLRPTVLIWVVVKNRVPFWVP